MSGPYINEPGYEVPKNNILVIPFNENSDGFYKEVIFPLKGEPKRDWFTSHFYYCLPLTIGNQYGFVIKSMRDFEVIWTGDTADVNIKFLNEDNSEKQVIKGGFGSGIITIQNMFSIKTPLGINIMTIQPPNMFIPGCVAMTGVIETDQIRRDFTFNLKITVPHYKIKISKGDALGAFIPIPRYFIDNFIVEDASNIFDRQLLQNEREESHELSRQRTQEDIDKPHMSGRKYFNGIHAYGEKYIDHQKRLT